VYFGLINTTNDAIRLEYGVKIIQFLLLDINYPKIEEVDISNLYKDLQESDRKGGFGSTGI
jgi:dUTPase